MDQGIKGPAAENTLETLLVLIDVVEANATFWVMPILVHLPLDSGGAIPRAAAVVVRDKWDQDFLEWPVLIRCGPCGYNAVRQAVQVAC